MAMDGFDTFLGEDKSDEPAEDEAVDKVAERRAYLEAMVARGGTAGELAKELLALAAERAERQEREEKISALEVAASGGDLDFEDAGVRDALRAQILERRAQAEASFRQKYVEAQVQKGFPEEVARTMADEAAAALPGDSWFWKSDPLAESPAFTAYETKRSQEERARRHAAEKAAPSLMESAEEAAAGIAETRARVAAEVA
jgi:hypothetical protein